MNFMFDNRDNLADHQFVDRVMFAAKEASFIQAVIGRNMDSVEPEMDKVSMDVSRLPVT